MSRVEQSPGHRSNANRKHACNDSEGGRGGDHMFIKSQCQSKNQNQESDEFQEITMLLKSHSGNNNMFPRTKFKFNFNESNKF